MFKFEIKTKGLDDFRPLVRNFPKMQVTLSKEVRKTMANIVVQELKKQVIQSGKVATWSLHDDIYSREISPNETRVYFGKPRSAYGTFVDMGAKNKRPPNPNIRKHGYSVKEWIQIKGIRPKANYPKAKYPRKKPPTMRQLAYAIAGGLASRKRAATYITRKALSKADSKIRKEIDREVDRILDIYGF